MQLRSSLRQRKRQVICFWSRRKELLGPVREEQSREGLVCFVDDQLSLYQYPRAEKQRSWVPDEKVQGADAELETHDHLCVVCMPKASHDDRKPPRDVSTNQEVIIQPKFWLAIDRPRVLEACRAWGWPEYWIPLSSELQPTVQLEVPTRNEIRAGSSRKQDRTSRQDFAVWS